LSGNGWITKSTAFTISSDLALSAKVPQVLIPITFLFIPLPDLEMTAI